MKHETPRKPAWGVRMVRATGLGADLCAPTSISLSNQQPRRSGGIERRQPVHVPSQGGPQLSPYGLRQGLRKEQPNGGGMGEGGRG